MARTQRHDRRRLGIERIERACIVTPSSQFRLSGDANVIARMRVEFDKGVVPTVRRLSVGRPTLSRSSDRGAQFGDDANPHDVSGVFKLWLRKLPAPVRDAPFWRRACGSLLASDRSFAAVDV